MRDKFILYFLKMFLLFIMIAWAILVFMFSAQNGSSSSKLSGKVVEKVLFVKDKYEAIKENYEENKEINFSVKSKKEITKTRIYRWQKLTRKIAHFLLYTIGGFSIYVLVYVFDGESKKTFKNIIISLILGIGYAITDEYHQRFTFGRTPGWLDVRIDSLGIITGIIFAIINLVLINKILEYIYERRKINGRF